MLPRNHPDRIGDRLRRPPLGGQCWADPAVHPGTHLGLPQLVDQHLDLGRAPGGANTGDKIMTLVASALAGGDCIDGRRVACWQDRAGAGLYGEGAVHPGDVPAKLPVGPRPPTGSK